MVYLQTKQIDAFVANFKDNFYCNINSVKYAVKQQSIFNIIEHASGYKANFVILKNQEYRQTEFKRRVLTEHLEKQIYLV